MKLRDFSFFFLFYSFYSTPKQGGRAALPGVRMPVGPFTQRVTSPSSIRSSFIFRNPEVKRELSRGGKEERK